jgi:hypothetical protein
MDDTRIGMRAWFCHPIGSLGRESRFEYDPLQDVDALYTPDELTVTYTFKLDLEKDVTVHPMRTISRIASIDFYYV